MTYSIRIVPSDEDEGFIAVVPEHPGCSTFGETEEEALSEVRVAIGLRLDTARKEGREIPEPSGREHFEQLFLHPLQLNHLSLRMHRVIVASADIPSPLTTKRI